MQLQQALFLCALFLSKMENVHLFSSSLPRFDKCHETSRIFPRTEQTFASARSFGVISWALFWRKNGWPVWLCSLSKSPPENECAKWYQNFGTVKICGRQRGILVILCKICQDMDKKANIQEAKTSLKSQVKTALKSLIVDSIPSVWNNCWMCVQGTTLKAPTMYSHALCWEHKSTLLSAKNIHVFLFFKQSYFVLSRKVAWNLLKIS